MTKEQAIEYAVNEIPNILPYLDKSNIEELCDQVLTNNKITPTEWNNDGIANGFIDILGASDVSFDFVFHFNEKLQEAGITPVKKETTPAAKTPSYTPSPVPAPATSPPTLQKPKATVLPNKVVQTVSPPVSNQKTEPAKPIKKSVKIQNLNEVESYLRKVELDNNDTENVVCNCQGARHGLFDIVPNCLNCGKIICMKEGKSSNFCSFCKTELLPIEERLRIIELLEKEKESLQRIKNLEPKPTVAPKKQFLKLQNNKGGNFWESQQKFFDQVEREKERERKREQVLQDQELQQRELQEKEEEGDENLQEARRRLQTLLLYQDTSAERTRIIDNASDFNISEDVNGIWGSSQERALMIKKQQRNLQKLEKLKKERSGRDKVVVDISIDKNGKAVIKQKTRKEDNTVYARDDEVFSDEEGYGNSEDLAIIQDLEQEIQNEKQSKQKKMHNSVWDYKKDQKQYATPVYTKTAIETPESATQIQWKHKVQIGSDDSNLEENILAVL